MSLDDHEVISAGLKGVLNRAEGVNLVGSTTEASNIAPMVTQLNPHVVFLDVYLGEDPTWQTCKQIADIAQGPAVIIYSSYGNAQLLDQAMAAGASGYVLKATPASALVPIIRKVGDGQCHWEPSIYRLWRRDHTRLQSAMFPERELQIIRFIAQGLDNFEIAEQLHISQHTVKFHISKALKRTGEGTRAGLVRLAMANHVITPTGQMYARDGRASAGRLLDVDAAGSWSDQFVEMVILPAVVDLQVSLRGAEVGESNTIEKTARTIVDHESLGLDPVQAQRLEGHIDRFSHSLGGKSLTLSLLIQPVTNAARLKTTADD